MDRVLQGKGRPSETGTLKKGEDAPKGGKATKALSAQGVNVNICDARNNVSQRADKRKDKVSAKAAREAVEKNKSAKSQCEYKSKSQSLVKEKTRAAGRLPDRAFMADSSGEESEPELIYPSNGVGLCMAEVFEGSNLGLNHKLGDEESKGFGRTPNLPIASVTIQGEGNGELQDISNKSPEMPALPHLEASDEAQDVPAGKNPPLGGEQKRNEGKEVSSKASVGEALPEKPAERVAERKSGEGKLPSKGNELRKSGFADPESKPKPMQDPQRVVDRGGQQDAIVAPVPGRNVVILRCGSPKSASASQLTEGKTASLGNKTHVRGPQDKSGLSDKPSGLSGQRDSSKREKLDKAVGGPGSTQDPLKPRSRLSKPQASGEPQAPGKSEHGGVEVGLRGKGDQQLEAADAQEIEPLSGLEGCAWTRADTDKVLEVLRKVGREMKVLKVRAFLFLTSQGFFISTHNCPKFL